MAGPLFLTQPRGTRGDTHRLRLLSQTPGNPHRVKTSPAGKRAAANAHQRYTSRLCHSFGAASARTEVDAADARPSRRRWRTRRGPGCESAAQGLRRLEGRVPRPPRDVGARCACPWRGA